jgi:hypothetical protein
MHHRKLPPELRQCVRRYHQYRWVATHGVSEESLLKDLPIDLRRDIKRHLCLDLVRKVLNNSLKILVILKFSVRNCKRSVEKKSDKTEFKTFDIFKKSC